MHCGLLAKLTLIFGILAAFATSSRQSVLREQNPTEMSDIEKIQLLVDRRSPDVSNLVSQMLAKLNDGGSNALQVRRQILSRKFWK